MIQSIRPINIESWTVEDFKNSRKEWGDLLKRSNCDQFFLSWEWLFTWWDTYHDSESMQLNILAARNEAGTLIGIAPLYIHQIKVKKIFTSRNLQFIGNCWRGKSTIRTELMEFITDPASSEPVITLFYRHMLSNKNWDELILSNLLVKSDTFKFLKPCIQIKNCYIREPEFYYSYYIENCGSFDDYLSGLGKNTRLKLYNRRKILENIAGTKFIQKNNRSTHENLSLLNSFHTKRWGKPVFENDNMTFNLSVSRLFSDNNALQFSEINCNDEVISIQYNYLVNNKLYNIQSGFQESFHKKLALGYLHFGYEIEEIFNNKIRYYDFLAGDGKNTNYKASLTTQKTELVNIQVIRNRKLQAIYFAYDLFSRLKTFIAK